MKNRKRMKDPFEKSKGVNFALTIIMIVGFLSAATQIATTVLVSWRVADPILYTYVYRNSTKKLSVGVTRYGLYKVHYDNEGIVETWTQRVENMKTYGAIGSQQGQNDETAGTLSLFTSVCPEACRNAINVRIDAYERVSFISLVFLCSLVVTSAVAILSIGWNLLFAKSTFILMGAFVLSLVINATAGGYWFYETDLTWNLVVKAQQYPFPRCSYSFFIFVGCTATYGLCFLVLLLTEYISKLQQRKAKMNKLRMHNNVSPMMNPSQMMYPPVMYNNPSGLMQRSASFASPMGYSKSGNFDYSSYMHPPMNYQNDFLNSSSRHLQPNYYQPMARNYSYSAGMGSPSGYFPNPYLYDNNGYAGNFTNMLSNTDMNLAKQYSGMNYVNNPYGPNSSFRF